MGQKMKVGVACILLIAMLLVIYLVMIAVSDKNLAPASGSTFATFAQSMPSPSSLQLAKVGNREYLIWSGSRPPFWKLSSGPPAYVFDDVGNCIDWTPDSGEAPTFTRKWCAVITQPNLTVDSAREWLARSARLKSP